MNRNESLADFLSAAEIVAMLVETVAKGGNLLLNVGPAADGRVPDDQAGLLRNREHGSTRTPTRSTARPAFTVPGSGAHWYTRTGDVVHAFDLVRPEPSFASLAGVTSVTTPAGAYLTFPRSRAGSASSIDARRRT